MALGALRVWGACHLGSTGDIIFSSYSLLIPLHSLSMKPHIQCSNRNHSYGTQICRNHETQHGSVSQPAPSTGQPTFETKIRRKRRVLVLIWATLCTLHNSHQTWHYSACRSSTVSMRAAGIITFCPVSAAMQLTTPCDFTSLSHRLT